MTGTPLINRINHHNDLTRTWGSWTGAYLAWLDKQVAKERKAQLDKSATVAYPPHHEHE